MASLPAMLVGGCKPAQYAQQADSAAYEVLAEKRDKTLGAPGQFDVAYRPVQAGEAQDAHLLRGRAIPIAQEQARTLSLDESLELAFRNSREFQNRKEGLYLAALGLASARHRWSLLGGALDGRSRAVASDGGKTDYSSRSEPQLRFARQFAAGGRLALTSGLELASDMLGLNSTSLGSLLEANLTQPLWRGAWRDFAYEDLYRQERDLAIAILEYERFVQGFGADIARRYYQVLQQLDQLENQRASIARLEETLKLTRVKVEGGQASRTSADQAEQDLINARIRHTRDIQDFQNALDNYKLALGLPIEAAVVLDEDELVRLNEHGPLAVPFEEARAIEIAMESRPDVLQQAAKVRDAARDVELAADRFNPGVDLSLRLAAGSNEPRRPWRVNFGEASRMIGADLDYSFDQTDNRDRYRQALISESRSQRERDALIDRVRLEVRQAYRQLLQARQSYELQQRNVEVARRRSRLAGEEQKAGLAAVRDVLEAEEALRQALNGLTGALVSYETTRLNFLASLGLLGFTQDGKVYERLEPYGIHPQRAAEEQSDTSRAG